MNLLIINTSCILPHCLMTLRMSFRRWKRKNAVMLDVKAPKLSAKLSTELVTGNCLEQQERDSGSSGVAFTATHPVLSHARFASCWPFRIGSLHARIPFFVAGIWSWTSWQSAEVQLILLSDNIRLRFWGLSKMQKNCIGKKTRKHFRYKNCMDGKKVKILLGGYWEKQNRKWGQKQLGGT